MREMKDSGIEWIGEIPKNKKVLRNKYMFSYEKGRLPSSTNLDKKGFAYIGATDLDSRKNEYSTYTEDETLPNAEYDDLLILWDGARAGLCGTHKIGKMSSTIVRIKGDETVYQPFLYWYYKGFENFMYQSVNGTTIPHMNRKYIENIGFINWTIEEQHRISAYLDTKCNKIDSIIEKQEKIIEKLKAYKLSVITEAVTKGLNPDVKMKDSGVEWIGEIPEKWMCINLIRTADKNRTYAFGDGDHGLIKTEDYKTEGIPFIRVQNVGWCEELDLENVVYISEKDNQRIANSTLRPGDILFVKTGGTIGKTGIIPESLKIANTTSHVGKISISPRFCNKYILYLLSSHVGYRQFWTIASQKATRPELGLEEVKAVKITVPPNKSEQEEIVSYLDQKCFAIDKSIEQKQAIIEKLKEYKKSLIYEVVTGKKEV